MIENKRPEEKEYAKYYDTYVSKVKGENILESLVGSQKYFTELLNAIPKEKWDFSYDEGKWTIREVLMHIIETELVFSYRALRVSRNDQTPLVGFDQNDFIPNSNATNISSTDLIALYNATRTMTIHHIKNMTEEMVGYIGEASENPVSARALAFMIVGHQKHHCYILQDRYLDKSKEEA